MKNRPIFSTYQEIRPTLITVICIAGFIFNLCSIILVLFYPNFTREISLSVHATLPISMLLFAVATLVAYIGIWKMKLWGLLLYALVFICAISYCFIIQHHFFWGYIFSIVALLILLFYTKHFT